MPSGRQASGIGTERRYTFDDLVSLRTARELRMAGISTQALRRVVRFLKRHDIEKPLSELRLIIRAKDVLAVASDQELMSALNSPGQYAFSFLLDLAHIVKDIEKELKRVA